MILDPAAGDPVRTPAGAIELVSPELIAFDFDGTLVDQRGGWLLLQELFGTRERGKTLSERHRGGEITFQEWCNGNVALWAERGVERANVEAAADAVKLTRGATPLLEFLHESRPPYGTISGGIRGLQTVLDPFEPDFRFANELRFDDGTLDGSTARVGPNHKDEVLTTICTDYDIDPSNAFYVGDSHTDIEAFEVAGTTVLFDPDARLDEGVEAGVDIVVDERDLGHVTALLRGLLD